MFELFLIALLVVAFVGAGPATERCGRKQADMKGRAGPGDTRQGVSAAG